MKLCDFNGYEVHIPTSGGKAGKGKQSTTSIQLRKGNCILKQFRFKLDGQKPVQAIEAAKKFALTNP